MCRAMDGIIADLPTKDAKPNQPTYRAHSLILEVDSREDTLRDWVKDRQARIKAMQTSYRRPPDNDLLQHNMREIDALLGLELLASNQPAQSFWDVIKVSLKNEASQHREADPLFRDEYRAVTPNLMLPAAVSSAIDTKVNDVKQKLSDLRALCESMQTDKPVSRGRG